MVQISVTKQMLSEPWKRLVGMMQALNFGRITFRVRGGEPDLGRPYHTVRTVKLTGGDNRPRPEMGSGDFELRREHTAALKTLAHVNDGARVTIEVKHGLPFLIQIEQDHQVA